MDCPGHVISFKWLWNTRKPLYCNMNAGTFLTLMFMLRPLRCPPSTHMYLFLHSWELFLGRALASRTEITCLSHLQKQKRENNWVLIRLEINPVTEVLKDDTCDSSTPNYGNFTANKGRGYFSLSLTEHSTLFGKRDARSAGVSILISPIIKLSHVHVRSNNSVEKHSYREIIMHPELESGHTDLLPATQIHHIQFHQLFYNMKCD